MIAGLPAFAVHVPMEADGVVTANGLGSGPLAGVPAGSAVHMSFDVDSEDYYDSDPGHARSYRILNDTFVLTAGEAILENITGDQYIMITNDYWVVDGVHWFESNIGYGYWHEFELWGNSDEMFPSTDITECAGEYGPEWFEDTSWEINWAFFVRFDLLTIHEAPAGIGDMALGANTIRLSVSPNPACGLLRVAYQLGREGVGSLQLVDIAGRIIRSSVTADAEGILTWAFANESGEPVPAGVYFVRLEGGGRQTTQRIVQVQ